MKNLPFITHDIGARNDLKLVALQRDMGMHGLGIYWCIVEMLWEQDGYLPVDYPMIAYSLRVQDPEDIRKVVEDYGLCEHDDERFWSDSALERIAFMHQTSNRRSNAARTAGKASGEARSRRSGDQEDDPKTTNVEQTLNERSINSEQSFNERSTAVQRNRTNKVSNKVSNKVNKEINKSLYIPPLADKKRLFEIFFFDKNFLDPETEVQRFLTHYEGQGWKYGNGQPVTDIESCAKRWKPEKEGIRFDARALKWYKTVYAVAADSFDDPLDVLRDLAELKVKNDQLSVAVTDRAFGEALLAQVREKDLEKQWPGPVKWAVRT